ncbi:hypothetical protein ACS0TY_012137 [Phlomoides rotata]
MSSVVFLERATTTIFFLSRFVVVHQVETSLLSAYEGFYSLKQLLALKKLDNRVANQLKDDQFIELVNSLDKIRHENVVELMGYCSKHG